MPTYMQDWGFSHLKVNSEFLGENVNKQSMNHSYTYSVQCILL